MSCSPLVLAPPPGWTSLSHVFVEFPLVCSLGLLCSLTAQRPFPQPPPAQDGRVAQAWPIKALNPVSHSDWLKDGLKIRAWPIRTFLEYLAIVTAEDTCLIFGTGSYEDHQAWSCHWQLGPASWG